jgi:hypothetical protein
VLLAAGPLPCAIRDISAGGFGLNLTLDCQIGDEIRVQLPTTREPVVARVVRRATGDTGLFFRQDEATLKVVAEVMNALIPHLRDAA